MPLEAVIFAAATIGAVVLGQTIGTRVMRAFSLWPIIASFGASWIIALLFAYRFPTHLLLRVLATSSICGVLSRCR